MSGRIQCSHASAQLLMQQSPDCAITLRGKIKVKGKGTMMTYWIGDGNKQSLNPISDFSESEMKSENQAKGDDDESQHTPETAESYSAKTTDISVDSELKINSIADIMANLIRKLMATRPKTAARSTMDDQIIKALEGYLGKDKTLLEEATETIVIQGMETKRDPERVLLPGKIQQQIHSLVETIYAGYKPNAFHNFDHAVHMTTVIQRLLARAEPLEDKKTFGIGTDRLAHFALAFSSLIHDLDHRGVPNFVLNKADPELNDQFDGKSPQEQNSFKKGWEILMKDEFAELRSAIYHTQEELVRFRQIVVKAVIATDIFNPELAKAHIERWDTAFGKPAKDTSKEVIASRKATALIELLIQTGDVAHTMQSWNKFIKWNTNLFAEMYGAYADGYFDKDPETTWYSGEMKFFDGYIIPLAGRLHECGAFDSVGDTFLRRAKGIRAKWEEDGKDCVRSMSKAHAKKKPKKADILDDDDDSAEGL